MALKFDMSAKAQNIVTCDDSIAIKGTGTNGYNASENPANAVANQNIILQDIQVWSDANNALGIGAETVAQSFDAITFNNNHFQVNSFVSNLEIVDDGNPVAIANGPFGSNVHDAVKEFSKAQGANNWYYRSWTSGVGTSNMTWNPDQSGHWRGPKNYDAIWIEGKNLFLHPDTNQVLLEWKAPSSGEINIVGNVRKYDTGGDGVVVSIWKNNTLIWPSNWANISYQDTVGLNHNFITTVNTGDIISFRVDEGQSNAYDSTIWNTTIIYE